MSPDPDDVAALRSDVDAWFQRYHTLITRALPTPPWGPARLDAVGMIFDRLTGLDLGPPPSYLIEDNIAKADAPVRYPYVWNAPVQDLTQWPTFAENGNDVLALARNLGEVFGVFGTFEPTSNGLFIHFLNNNSANFDGLGKLEDLVKQIGPPKWPWLINTNLGGRWQGDLRAVNRQGRLPRVPRNQDREGPLPHANLADAGQKRGHGHPRIRHVEPTGQHRRVAGRLHPVRNVSAESQRPRLQHSCNFGYWLDCRACTSGRCSKGAGGSGDAARGSNPDSAGLISA